MQNSNIDIGTYGIWTGALDLVPSAQAGVYASEIEELGFGTLWLPETVFREVFLHSAFLLESTSRLKVATGIASMYGRDSLTCNAAMQTLNERFPGRFLLGLGVSHAHLVAGVRKQTYERPYSAMVDYLDLMERARFFAPRGEPDAQMVLAALGPRMIELAGTRTAGAHTYFVPPEHTVAARQILGPEPLLAVEQMVTFATDPAEARAIARDHMRVYVGLPNYANNLLRLGFSEDELADDGSDRVVDAVVAWGTMDTILGRVQEHLDAGADHVCIQVLDADKSRVPSTEWRELASALSLQ